MSIAKDIARAVQQEMRSVLRGGFLHPPQSAEHHGTGVIRPAFSTAQVAAMLRIELTYEAAAQMEYEQFQIHHEPWGGAYEFQGVAMYVIPRPIPAPGWRVINPMRVK